MSGDVNAADVDRRLARLEDEWDPFHVEREAEAAPAEEFEPFLANARAGYTGGGYVWAVREPDQAAELTESMPDDATQDEDRVLLGMGRGVDRWGPPGGGREEDETYEEAAVREVDEETGVRVAVTDLAHAVRFVTACEDGREERVHTLFVVFEGCYVDGHVEVQPGELNGAAWFRELPANLHPFAEPLAASWAGGQAGSA